MSPAYYKFDAGIFDTPLNHYLTVFETLQTDLLNNDTKI